MPDWKDDLRARLATLNLPAPREAEIIDELSQHLEDHYRESIAAGHPPEEASRLALAQFQSGNVLARYISALRLAHPAPAVSPGTPSPHVLAGIWQDLRHALRMVRKQRSFAAIAILTLALGIGANSAIFALVDATLLRPLPFPHADRLLMLYERSEVSPRGRVSPLNLVDWQERSQSLEAIGGFVPNVGSMVYAAPGGTAETISRQWVTYGIFDALGVTPVAGRTFKASDDINGTGGVIISESLWRTRFNSDPSLIGTTMRLDGDPYPVIGVVPGEAQVIGRSDMWVIRTIHGLPPAARRAYALHAVGRLKAGVSREAAAADLAAVADGLAREFPATNARRGVTVEPLHDVVIGTELRQTASMFLGVVGFVLLICCANVANLLLTRTTARSRELALRLALGADRRRLVGLVLTESLVLSLLGGVAGLGVAALILRAAPAVIPEQLLPAAVTLALDARVVLFCALTAVVVGIVFGLVPAWKSIAMSKMHASAANTRTIAGSGGRMRDLLVAAQVATAVTLLVGAGLLLRSMLAVESVDRGYGASRVLTMMVDPPGLPSLLRFYEDVEAEIRRLPAVGDVAWATTVPMGQSYEGDYFYQVEGTAPAAPDALLSADYQIVSPAYFTTVDVPIVAGRAFDTRDTLTSVPVAIVNEAFVRRHFQGRSPIGARVATGAAPFTQQAPVVREIVGVARQVKGRPDETDDLRQIYVPMAQQTPGDIFLLVRAASGRAEDLASGVRGAIARMDANQLVSVRNLATLDEVAREATARHRFRAVLVMAFAGLALVLSMVGLFGILAYSVHQRMREFGVRRALGATTADVLRLVGGSAARVIGAGALVGLGLAMLSGHLLSAMLFGVEPRDPATFAGVIAVLALTALMAMAAPAWRATRVDPAIALRND